MGGQPAKKNTSGLVSPEDLPREEMQQTVKPTKGSGKPQADWTAANHPQALGDERQRM